VYVHQGEQPDDPNDANDWLKHIVDISAGSNNSIALEADLSPDPNSVFEGCVYTWGCNMWGEEPLDTMITDGRGLLGNGSNVDFNDTPVKVLRGEQDYNDPGQIYLEHIVAITAGWDHLMALEKYDVYDPYLPNFDPNHKGRVYTWGNNGAGWDSGGGRLGNGAATDGNSTPVLVLRGEQPTEDPNDPYPYLSRITAVSGGEGHSMALDADGYVYTWGDNRHGQLGNGCDDPCTTPVRVVGEDGQGYLENIVAISAAYWHSLAIDANGTIWTWGKGSAGGLGLGNKTIDCNTPHPIPVVYNVTQETFAFAIQRAIDDANNAGDTLEASPGTYYENVNFRDKSVTLRSTEPGDSNVATDTIVDGAYNSGSDYHFYQAVDFNDGSGSTLAGLTVMNGPGGGVLCEGVNSVTVMSCLIRNNGCDGIWLNASSVDILNCEIRGNASDETSDYHGVYCISDSDVNIVNCTIADNDGNGIACNQSSAAITGSAVQNNADFGVEAIGDCDITIERSLIEGNGKTGVYAYDARDFVLTGSVVRKNGWDGVGLEYNNSNTLTNNWIHNNGTAHHSEGWGSGIWFENQPCVAIVRNNTIYDNWTYGIQASEYGADPNIINCIIWGNDSNDLYRKNGDFETVNYCCLQNARAGGLGNKTGDPGFMNIATDANDLHLDESSQCKDAGDPNGSYGGESDIDGEDRVVNGRVDMGADEYYWSSADFDDDGIVNFIDYAVFAAAWHTEPNDANYNELCDLQDNNNIDFNDLGLFCEDWLSNAESWPGPMPLMAGRGGAGMLEGSALDAGLSAVAAAERGPAVAEPVDIEAIMKWLAEIWLDPDVRKSIDEENFLKFYESLKELE